MAKNKPVIIWVPKHKASKEPKFHQAEILAGQGKSIKAPFTIFNAGCVFRKDIICAGGYLEDEFTVQEAAQVYINLLILSTLLS